MSKFFNKTYPVVYQHDAMDCGPACLASISEYYGNPQPLQTIRELCFLSKDGVSLLGIEDGAKSLGLDTKAVKISPDIIDARKPLPCILYWNENHYVVLYDIKVSKFSDKKKYYLMDPARGRVVLDEVDFKRYWSPNSEGICLLLQTTDKFNTEKTVSAPKIGYSFLSKFFRPQLREIFVLLFAILLSSGLNLVFPFLTQSLIDDGVNAGDLDSVFVILLAQIFLFLGAMTIEVVRNWVLLYINSIVNLTLIKDYLYKIIMLPFKFFDSKQLGDFSTRIGDHQRVEEFLTSQAFIAIFSVLNFIVYFFVLWSYSLSILIIYVLLTICALIWSIYFLRKLKLIDYRRYNHQKSSQQGMFEIINGIVEIKLNNIEEYKVTKWSEKQEELFESHLETLRVEQYQNSGFNFINQFKDIFVIYLSAQQVILGNITLGALLSISYIIGQMNGPLNQFIAFIRSYQYAKLSLDRLQEVQLIPDEDLNSSISIESVLEKGECDINISDLSYQYHGPRSPKVLDDITLLIPSGKTTAIVGESGSGKTTLIKLLLKFYAPVTGQIEFGSVPLESINSSSLRSACGVVMQDGYLFSDSIMNNITTGVDDVDINRYDQAVLIANLGEFIENLPLKHNTKIGSGGNDISGGEKQRMLIARAVYKNPQYIFFDEATSSLDARNEKIIYQHLNEFLKNKTVVKVAHRLSTVRNADQIIVLKSGRIVERGTHEELIELKDHYYNLVINQLELSA